MVAKAKLRSATDAVIAIVAVVALFLGFLYIDAFELFYETTRAHEDWEVDEVALLVMAMPLPLAWFAFRRWREAVEMAAIRIAAENDLAHARKIESLGALAGGMAHDINNHLVPILGMTELLMMKTDKEDPDYRRLELVHMAARRTQHTIAKVLRFARREKNVGTGCDLSTVARELIEVLEISCPSSVRMNIRVADNIGIIRINHDELESVIVNLFSNAVAAMDGSHGSLDIVVDAVDRNSLPSTLKLPPGRIARIVVRDTGEGMSEQTIRRIFDPFFTTRAVGKGTGLGLAQVNGIIKSVDGTIDVQSEIGVGTTMTVYLPVDKN